MTTKELIEYLERFPPDTIVRVLHDKTDYNVKFEFDGVDCASFHTWEYVGIKYLDIGND